ncbi:MAG TPA: cytochrome c oxidase assembly protein [Solirubrobacteraceae bacterium]|nr:cytochrome c oxidase assembly protein [Solirubrobacteraceae bacterium]
MHPSVSPEVSWSFEPTVLAGMAIIQGLYVVAWRRARATGAVHRPGWGRMALFSGGILVVLIALVSPIDALAEQLLLMHMVQHVLLLDIAPILCILGTNKVLLRPITRRITVIERRAGYLAHPVFAVVLYTGVMWGWHVPSMYDAALRNTGVHAFEHLCFGIAGSLYWWHLLSPIRGRMRLRGMGPIAYMTATKLLVGALGIVLSFAPASFYAFYAHHPYYWGLSPQNDQSLAGLVMALEQSVVMGIALVYLFTKMLGESESDAQRAERYEVAGDVPVGSAGR